MTHKEEMNMLKKQDPILYYELTCDPTNANENYGGFTVVALVAIIILLIICFR